MNKSTVLIISFLLFHIYSVAFTADNDEDLIRTGWVKVQGWDFYDQLEGWNSEMIKDNQGVIKVEDGVLEFGRSQNGGIIYYQTNTKALKKNSYMIIAKIQANNPEKVSLGFYSPKKKKMFGQGRIKKTDWIIATAIISIDPRVSKNYPKKIYPAIQLESKKEYVRVKWIELWMFPKRSAKVAAQAQKYDQIFPKKTAKTKNKPHTLGFNFGYNYILNLGSLNKKDDILHIFGSLFYRTNIEDSDIFFFELELGMFAYKWSTALPIIYHTNVLSLPLTFSLVTRLELADGFSINPVIGLGYMLGFGVRKNQSFPEAEKKYLLHSIVSKYGIEFQLDFSKSIAMSLGAYVYMAQDMDMEFGKFNFFFFPRLAFHYQFGSTSEKESQKKAQTQESADNDHSIDVRLGIPFATRNYDSKMANLPDVPLYAGISFTTNIFNNLLFLDFEFAYMMEKIDWYEAAWLTDRGGTLHNLPFTISLLIKIQAADFFYLEPKIGFGYMLQVAKEEITNSAPPEAYKNYTRHFGVFQIGLDFVFYIDNSFALGLGGKVMVAQDFTRKFGEMHYFVIPTIMSRFRF